MLEQVFPGESEMARRMRQHDWSRTPLGPVERWSPALRNAVTTSLTCAFPICIWVGPELALLYNDEYRPILGSAKHPTAMAVPGARVWAEIWSTIGPMLAQVMEHGEATRSRDLMLHIDREGYREEAYFSFSYSPIYDEHGKIVGVFCPVIETTEKVVGDRRLRTLRDLARCKGAESEAALYAAAAKVLEENQQDIPFALIYRVDDGGERAELVASSGIEIGAVAAPVDVDLDALQGGTWLLGTVAQSGGTATISDLSTRFDELPTGSWALAPDKALVLPIQLPGQERPRAVLVLALSPLRALDDAYRTFCGLVATQIESSLADVQALEDERRRAEALAEIDRAKTVFFSNVSHEFRTPLTLMLGPLEDVLSEAHGAVPREVATTLAVAHRNSLRLLRLVNTLLDFSRIEAGRVEANYEPTDLVTLTSDLAGVFRSAIERAGLRLVVDCAPLREPAYVDRDMWEKIVLNLLSNALKFTFEGTIRVGLRSQDGRIELSVSDTGVGIAEADLPKMFQRFERVKNARSRSHEGTGIGLALVQELTKIHGGEVSLESQEGVGSRFTLTIPNGKEHLPEDHISIQRELPPTSLGVMPFIEEALRWLPEADTEIRGEAPSSARHTMAGARVLVADDNADMREYVSRLLGRSYEVIAVEDGQAALDQIRSDPPDLVLADVMMPHLDGFELLAAIRADERTRTLPVIMLSARAGEEARIEGLDAGADEYLTKPFAARELMARVSSQLTLSRQRREAERALRYQSTQFEMLLDQAPMGVYLVDGDLRIQAANALALPAFGDVPGGVVGRDFHEIMQLRWEQDYADEMVSVFRHTLETGEPYVASERAEFRFDRGVTEYFDWRLDRITLPDGRHGLVCYFRDVSTQVWARKALEDSREALKQADARKDEFLGTLAHELRNPLAPIKNSLHALRVAGNDEVGASLREMMGRQVDQLVRLVDDLMEVSRITRGKIELRKQLILLEDVVRNAVETSRPLIEAGRHQLRLALPPQPLILDADPVRLAQVLSNLLNNAAKYTPAGGRIWLTAEQHGPEVAISVRDSGAGISNDMLPRVFDLFTQVGRNYGRAGGLGIGLTLARSLAELHGGSIVATSDGLGRGSEFVLRLPLADDEAARPEEQLDRSGLPPRRILVVDDNHDSADSLSLLLENMGAEVHTVYDGYAALEAFRTYRPSVVLLDIGMPDIDGYEIARRTRQQADTADVTLIALTGWGQEDDRRRSREAGIDHHMVKPIDLDALERVLAALPA